MIVFHPRQHQSPEGLFKTKIILFKILVIFFIITAFFKIGIHERYIILPVFYFVFGLMVCFLKKEIIPHVFLILLPLIGSTPGIFFIGHPHNYIGPIVFLLSGIYIGLVFKKDPFIEESWNQEFDLYFYFLIILLISVCFVFLRWSNLTISGRAFCADTPVSPQMERVSFGSIFSVASLFFYGVTPLIFLYFRKIKFSHQKAFDLLSYGFYCSVGIAILQKYFDFSLFSHRITFVKNQYNGGFSDFNSFGFFSGFMFLWATDHIMEKRVTGFLTLMAALLGIILSGSRAAFFFILAALINLFFKLKVRHKKKIIVIILIFIFLIIVVAGGTFKERLVGSFSQGDNLFDTLNKLSNGRLWMSRFSLQTIKDFYLTGIGLGNFTFYLKYKNFNQYYVYDLTLNQYLQVFTETGFWGFLFFTFFLIFLLLKSSKKLFMGTILFVLLLNNYFWFPEILIIFWLIGALFYNERKIQIKSKIPFFRFMIWLAILSVIVGNIFVFSHLHPKNWAVEKGVYYDYGFWYPERDHQGRIFKWTRHKSGIYTCLDQKGESSSFYILCSAPLEHLPGKVQKVFVYWRGEKYNTITFRHNCSETFKIKGKPFQSGFLELRIEPTFCLKELNLGEEKRHLGVQFYVNSF